MEMKQLLRKSFQTMVFSSLFVFVYSSCLPDLTTSEWWFHNRLEDDVELHLFFPPNTLNGQVRNLYMVPTGDSVMLYSLKDRHATRGAFFNDFDSAKVNIIGSNSFVATWRYNGHYDIAEGYENLPDFYRWHHELRSVDYVISPNLFRYRYYLSAEEQVVD